VKWSDKHYLETKKDGFTIAGETVLFMSGKLKVI